MEEGVIQSKRPLEASTEGDGMGHVAHYKMYLAA